VADSEVDISDKPEVTDWTGLSGGALYRPVKRLEPLQPRAFFGRNRHEPLIFLYLSLLRRDNRA
jgi:hypothetical protein